MAIALTVAMTASCGGKGDADSATAPTVATGDDFCSVLREGTRELDDRTTSAGSSSGEQLQLFVENYADFSRLLRRLEAVAPPEIRSDMNAVVRNWESQADTASQAADNPLGAFAGTLVRSLLSGASYEAIDDYALENCGRRLFGAATDELTAAADAADDPLAAVEAGPDEATLVLCKWEGIRLLELGLTSGNFRRSTPDHAGSIGSVAEIFFDGQSSGPLEGLASIICAAPPRTLFSDDFSHIVGVASFTDGTQVPVLVDLEAPVLHPQVAVSAGPLQDFGPHRPETLAASFTPDGRGLFWRESSGGQCSSYLVPDVRPGQTIARDTVAQYKLGDGGSCYNEEMFVRWAGDTPTVCTHSFGCDDANGQEVDVEQGGVTQTDGVSDDELPQSERYNTSSAWALRVEELGVTYFIGVDSTTDESVLFSWAGGNSQPVKVHDLGTGRFSIIAYRPAV